MIALATRWNACNEGEVMSVLMNIILMPVYFIMIGVGFILVYGVFFLVIRRLLKMLLRVD